MISTLRSWWQDRLLRGIVKNSSYLFSSSSAAIVLSMFQGIFAARLLGAYDLGVLTGAIIPIVSDAHRLLSFRMSELVVKYFQEALAVDDKNRAAAVVKAAALVEMANAVLAYLLVVLFAPLAATYFAKDISFVPLYRLYGLYLFAMAVYETSVGVLQSRRKFSHLALVNFIQNLITFSVILAAYVRGGGLLDILLAYLAGKSFAGLAVTVLAYRQLGGLLGPGWWRASLEKLPPWRELARFAVSTNLNATINLFVRDNETVLITFLRSPLEAGYYKIALTIIGFVLLPIDQFIAPTYAEISGTISKRMYGVTRSLLKRVSLISGIWTISTGLVLVAFGWWLVPFAYGEEFAASYPALVILLAGYGLANILHWNRPLLLALGMPEYPIKVQAAVGAVKTAATLLFVPVFGYLAEAVIQSAYFLASIGMISARGLGELRRRALAEGNGPSLSELQDAEAGRVP